MWRSILAVVVGYLVMAVAVMVLFAIAFRAPDQKPTVGFMVFAVGYGFVAAIAGGYVTAAIARRAPLAHAAALAVVSAAMGLVSLITSGGREPVWFLGANVVAMIAGVLLGGAMRARRSGAGGGTPAPPA
jgi:hypothetical protein